MFNNFTNVEKAYIGSVEHRFPTNIPYITVENFPKLGKLTAFRFLEWAAEHPDGVISLPTGKTPEYFIAWVKKVLTEWDTKEGAASREESGLLINKKPDLRGLHFVQIDELLQLRAEILCRGLRPGRLQGHIHQLRADTSRGRQALHRGVPRRSDRPEPALPKRQEHGGGDAAEVHLHDRQLVRGLRPEGKGHGRHRILPRSARPTTRR